MWDYFLIIYPPKGIATIPQSAEGNRVTSVQVQQSELRRIRGVEFRTIFVPLLMKRLM